MADICGHLELSTGNYWKLPTEQKAWTMKIIVQVAYTTCLYLEKYINIRANDPDRCQVYGGFKEFNGF